MNEKLILQMVAPYLNGNNELSFETFENIFSMLSKKEQYEASNILSNNGINLIDSVVPEDEELELDEDNESDVFQIRYDDAIFASEEIEEKNDNKADDIYDYLSSTDGYKASNTALLKQIKNGSTKAKEAFCEANKRLVYKLAIRYSKQYNHKLSLDDLFQAGMIGMLKAIDKFDFDEGTSFSTYAVWWIRQSIIREIFDNGFSIRIPVHMMEKVNRVYRLEQKYSDISRIDEKINLISNELNMTYDQVIECIIIRQNYIQQTSLDTPVGENEDLDLRDVIHDQKKTIEDLLFDNILKEELSDLF